MRPKLSDYEIAIRKRRQAKLARSVLDHFRGDAEELARQWIGFNALYDVAAGRTERERFSDAIRVGLTDEQAQQILHACEDEVAFLGGSSPQPSRLAVMPA